MEMNRWLETVCQLYPAYSRIQHGITTEKNIDSIAIPSYLVADKKEIRHY